MRPFLLAQAGGETLTAEELAAHPLAAMVSMLYMAAIVLGCVFAFGIFQTVTKRRLPWRSHALWLYERPWTFKEVWFFAVVMVVMHLVVGLAWKRFASDGFADTAAGTNFLVVGGSVAFHWSTLFAVLVLLRIRKLNWSQAFGIRKTERKADLKRGARYYLAVLPAILVMVLLYEAFMKLTGQEIGIQDSVDMILNTKSIPMLVYLGVLAVVVAPIVEEILFRGVLFPWLAKKTNLKLAMAMVSIVFGLIHGFSSALLPLTLLSVCLCVAYLRTRSLLVPIVMHALFNGVNLFVMLSVKDLVDLAGQ